MKSESTEFPGKLFVFEGPDGIGKSTLLNDLFERFIREGAACAKLAFPGNIEGTLGKDVYDLHHRALSRIHPTSLQILHIAAHVEAIERNILPALEEGTTVILDRYWWSTWVYGMVDGADAASLNLMIELEKLHWKEVRPAALFLVQRDEPLRKETTPERWRSLAEKYSELATREENEYPIYLINNQDRIFEVGDRIYSFAKASVRKDILPQQTKPAFDINIKLSPAKPTPVFDTYWRFAGARQDIFFKRFQGFSPPWTDDPILRDYKFTNAYRASDRVSQYLIRNVIYSGGDQSCDEIFFRILLFKFFNKIETWQLLCSRIGQITFREYSFERYSAILDDALQKGIRIYSAAYIMPTGERGRYARKHVMHLKLLERMMADELPSKIVDALSMTVAFDLLREYPTIGDFLAYQFIIDLNYSTLLNFSEMDFVVAGPGARDGIKKCFSDTGGLSDGELIKVVAELQDSEFARLGIEFQSLWGRKLQLIDCQNLFCEVDKYSRKKHPEIAGHSGRSRIKQRYQFNPEELEYWYPPKWELNERIDSEKYERRKSGQQKLWKSDEHGRIISSQENENRVD